MPTIHEHNKALRRKEQRKERHQEKRVHHDTALLEPFRKLRLERFVALVTDGILDGLVLEQVHRDIHLDRVRLGKSRIGVVDGCTNRFRHVGRKRGVPFVALALQGARPQERLNFTVVRGRLAQEHRPETHAVNLHVSAAPYLGLFRTERLGVGHLVPGEQIVQIIPQGRQGVRLFLCHFPLGLVQGNKSLPHAHGVISRNLVQGLVYGKSHLGVKSIEGVFFGLGRFFGFGGNILAGLNFFAYAAQIRRELCVAAVQFAGLHLMFLGQLGFGITLAPVGRFQFF